MTTPEVEGFVGFAYGCFGAYGVLELVMLKVEEQQINEKGLGFYGEVMIMNVSK